VVQQVEIQSSAPDQFGQFDANKRPVKTLNGATIETLERPPATSGETKIRDTAGPDFGVRGGYPAAETPRCLFLQKSLSPPIHPPYRS
jgi:hypothetical protein